MNDTQSLISDVWKHEQDILDVVHKICVENNLRYSLIFGTLLGAVRHSGFIPWDDDVDIIMPRNDYEKLLSIWNDVSPKEYILQNKRTDPDFTQNFTKIRKDNTTFIQDEVEKTKKYHTGIFIDIFPADRVAPIGIKRKKQYIENAFNLLCARGYTSSNKGVLSFVEKMILSLPQNIQLKIYYKTEKSISKWVNNTKLEWYSPNTIKVCKRYFNSNLFDNLITLNFNGKEYFCVSDYHSLLTKIYGDYLTLPPIEKRTWTHHPIIIDFERNYNKLK